MIEELIACDEARIPVIWFVTHEELRAEAEIVRYTKDDMKGELWIWSLTSNKGQAGWEPPQGTIKKNLKVPFIPEEDQAEVSVAIKTFIDFVAAEEEAAEADDREAKKYVALIRDPHVFLDEDMSFRRMLRDAARELRDTDSTIVCVSPIDMLPTDLKTDVVKIHAGLPKQETIEKMMKNQLEDYEIPITAKALSKLSGACCGMTLQQSADTLAKSLTKFGEINIQFISRAKTEAISKVSGLRYEGKTPSMDEVGGLAGIKEWMLERAGGFSQEARDFGLPSPRGVLCLGIPGTGKSLFSKAVAAMLDLPLIALTTPDLKGGIVGETEENVRNAFDTINTIGNCVVRIDEMEKGLPSSEGRNLDAGASDAVLGGLLKWMQDRESGAFLVATANDISAMRPELLRKGRFDAIFFVDLPDLEERKEIFLIHLAKRNRKLSSQDIATVSMETKGYSGAEIEASVIDGLWKAWSDGKRKMTTDDILSCIRMDVPLSQTMAEHIKALREWADKRARSASKTTADMAGLSKDKKSTKKPGRRKLKLEKAN